MLHLLLEAELLNELHLWHITAARKIRRTATSGGGKWYSIQVPPFLNEVRNTMRL
jgi:hypothetical protein